MKLWTDYLGRFRNNLCERPAVRKSDGRDCGSGAATNLLDLPVDLILLILQFLQPRDIIRLESSCVWLREMVVQYSVYRARLDRMFRAKRLNNYMLLPDSGRCSQQQASTYYKLRLYRYCHRSRLRPVDQEQDDYIQTYKTELKRRELEALVAHNMRRFSITGIL